MKPILYYFFQVAVASGILYSYYYLALRNKKFHQYNRFYILSAVIISILIPFLNIPVYFTESETRSSVVLQTLQHITLSTPENEIPVMGAQPVASAFSFDWNIVWYVIYTLVALLFLLRILFSLKKIKTTIQDNPVEELNGIHFVNTTEPGTPYSFFRWLFWNKKIELRSEKGEQIFRHEVFHIQEKHSLDILFLELVTIFFWVNPFFHLMKKELKAIHEFLADRFAAHETKKWEYAELLLMQALNTQQPLVNPFFHNQIKRRIAMITNPQKTSYKYLRKLLVLPVAAIVVSLFAFKYKSGNQPVLALSIVPVTVVIDAGHGGNDPGVQSPDQKYSEAQLTLQIAKTIQQLSKDYNVNVVMTRENENFPGNAATKYEGLRKRVEISEKIKPAAFISIHINGDAGGSSANSGFEAYIAGRKEDPDSRKLASLILQNVSSIYPTNNKPMQRHEPGIYVLDDNNCPSVILECGYITNASDLDFMVNHENQEKIARSILTAVINYKKQLPGEDINTRDTIPRQAIELKQIKENSFPGQDSLARPLVVIDGVVAGNLQVSELDVKIPADEIESINILKGNTAIARYGDKGKYGVIEIMTKNRKPSPIKELKLEEVKPSNDDNIVFEKMEIEPAFRGGETEWKKYLAVNFKGDVPVTHNAPAGTYTVYIQFIVHKDGSISDIRPLTNHGFGMEEEAIRVISKGPKWLPGMQNGKAVNAYKKQPITFKVGEVNEGKSGASGKTLPEIVMVAYMSPETKNQQPSPANIPNLPVTTGGSEEWRKFFERNLDPNTPVREGWTTGTYQVLIRFTENEDGTISEVSALNYQNSKTAEQCINLIRHIPKMLQDEKNAGNKKAQFIQPVIFFIEKDPNFPSV
ncbi:MAG: N-acetylmuramoyl-L-alanine amidase [Bacteroidota bacterium]|nr:N-acetylmuramoyl-L-alanine amidase [Bacteroidota bacterium]